MENGTLGWSVRYTCWKKIRLAKKLSEEKTGTSSNNGNLKISIEAGKKNNFIMRTLVQAASNFVNNKKGWIGINKNDSDSCPLLATVIVKILSNDKNETTIRALLDPGTAEGLDIAIIPPKNNNDDDTDKDSGPKLHDLLPNELLAGAVLINPN
ncbi:hypothetical protein PGB90_003970 [Kerria lacca]